MATLELNDAELTLVRRLVTSRLGYLEIEISHTDSREFKEMLRDQRDTLERLALKLGASR